MFEREITFDGGKLFLEKELFSWRDTVITRVGYLQ